MSIRLVREPSAPIQNKDDAKMIRYAYGGYDGVVKGFGQECAYTFENGIFKVGSGRIVLQGWEVDIDEFGWSLDLSNVTTLAYFYVVYLEVDLVNQQANLNYKFDFTGHPEINQGDDLTTYPESIARIPLYRFIIDGGEIIFISLELPIIPYTKDIKESIENGKVKAKIAKIATYASEDILKGTIEERLTKLGFKKGQVTPLKSVNLTQNEIKKIGTMVYGRYVQSANTQISYAVGDTVFQVPEDFRPYEDTTVYGFGLAYGSSGGASNLGVTITIKKDGSAIVSKIEGSYATMHIYNFNLTFGYLTVDQRIYEE